MTLHRPTNLVLAMAGALLLALLVALQWTSIPPVSIVTLPLVLFLPGYGLSAVLLGNYRVSRAARLLWSVGLSIAVAIVGGVLVALTPWGLQTTTWVILLAGVTCSAGGLAWLGGYGTGDRGRMTDEGRRRMDDNKGFRVSPGDAILFGLAVLAILAALQIAQLPAPPTSANGYTSLWILPSNSPNAHVIHFGFTSQEMEPVTYKVVVQVNGQPAQTWSEITLQPGEQWMNSFDASQVAAAAKIEADLYREDEPDAVYRSAVVNAN